MTEAFRLEVTIAAPIDEVWRAMREPGRIRHWHGWEFSENGGLDAEIDQIYVRNAKGDAGTHTLTMQGSDTFSLYDTGDGHTLVRLVRAPRGQNPEWDAFYDDISEGWTTFLQQLRFALERHPGSPRRTVYFNGAPLESLGLPENTRPGERYSASVAGETLAGEVWFRSANQAGFTVDGWGDGLLIVGAGPAGTVMAVLTTYGLDDEAYQRLRGRWDGLFPAEADA